MQPRLVAFLAAFAISACGGGGGAGGAGAGAPSADGPGRVESFSIASAATGASYPIDVYLPPAYDAASTARFPVIFAVDGDAHFGYVGAGNADVSRFTALKQVLQARGTAAILVGLGGTVRRNLDFLPPGSVAYHEFLAKELVPRVDTQYRTNTANRILSGLSYGGTITFLAFTYEAPASAAGTGTFRQFWSIETAAPNGDFGALPAAESALATQMQGKTVPLVLFLASGKPGNTTNAAIVGTLYAQMASHAYAGLDLQTASFATDHVGTDVPAFIEALQRFGL